MSKDTGGPAFVIWLKGGGEATVSPQDSVLTSGSQWRLGKNGYVYRVGGRVAGRPCLLHRIVLGAKHGVDVHHKSEDKTDCRRENLEQLSPSEHQSNHSHLVSARNVASRKYALSGVCKSCGNSYIKHPDHRGRQKYCSQVCAKSDLKNSRMEKRNGAI